MVKINKIYTRTGDDGSTGLVGGTRTGKDTLRVEAYGEVDELNAVIGMARTLAEKNQLKELAGQLSMIQNELFDAGGELATPPGTKWEGMKCLGTEHIKRLEHWIDQITPLLPELKSFVLPGGTELNAMLHLTRTVCRRVERSILRLSRSETVSLSLLIYFNRLSDLLFAMARSETHRTNVPEYLWKPGGT